MKRSLLFSAVLYAASLTSVHAAQPITEPEFASDIVDRYADHIFYGSGATGMALVVIDGNQRVFRSYGETRPGNNVRPQLDSVVRIASLTKLMTSEMLVKLLDQGTVKLNDPLSKYAPPGARVPTYNGTPITLVNLATHTSALPREQPGGAAHRPVFVWPTREQRWKYLSTAKLKAAPGSQAAYSNLAFDLLADALANASGKPYTQLFEEQITRPLGMKDTTYTPSPDQCRRLMVAERGASPCNNTLAAIGSGGVYSTPGDMMRWMQQYLSSDFYQRSNQADRMQTLIYQRAQFTKVPRTESTSNSSARTTRPPSYSAQRRSSGAFNGTASTGCPNRRRVTRSAISRWPTSFGWMLSGETALHARLPPLSSGQIAS